MVYITTPAIPSCFVAFLAIPIPILKFPIFIHLVMKCLLQCIVGEDLIQRDEEDSTERVEPPLFNRDAILGPGQIQNVSVCV